MNFLRKLINARFFPTATKPIISGLAASGIVYGLHALGLDKGVVAPGVEQALNPIVGFLTAAIVQQKVTPQAVATVKAHVTPALHINYKPGESLGQTIANSFLADVAREIDNDPTLVQQIGVKALERVVNPAQVSKAVTYEGDLANAVAKATQSAQAATPAGPVRSVEREVEKVAEEAAKVVDPIPPTPVVSDAPLVEPQPVSQQPEQGQLPGSPAPGTPVPSFLGRGDEAPTP